MRDSKETRKNELNSKNKTNKRNKIIRKDAKRGTTVIEFNLSKAVIMLIIIGVVLAGILTKEIVTTIIETNHEKQLANEEQIKTQELEETNEEQIKIQELGKIDGEQVEVQDLREANGDLGYITSVETKVQDGVGPFDENDEPGNDSGPDNGIVRSFDQITWTHKLTFGLKPGTTETNLKD